MKKVCICVLSMASLLSGTLNAQETMKKNKAFAAADMSNFESHNSNPWGLVYADAITENKAEAVNIHPIAYDLNGLKVAYVNATRAELTLYTPDAGEDSPGVLSCYDPAQFKEVIAQAKQQADLVVCCVHWGIEYSYELEQVQKDTARAYINAGADVIVGTHSHCLQGIEYYKGAPIFYNLGNFWFNEKDLLTCLLELHVTGTKEDWQLDATIVPAHQAGCVTKYLTDGSSVYNLLESISVNAGIKPNGTAYEKK